MGLGLARLHTRLVLLFINPLLHSAPTLSYPLAFSRPPPHSPSSSSSALPPSSFGTFLSHPIHTAPGSFLGHHPAACDQMPAYTLNIAYRFHHSIQFSLCAQKRQRIAPPAAATPFLVYWNKCKMHQSSIVVLHKTQHVQGNTHTRSACDIFTIAVWVFFWLSLVLALLAVSPPPQLPPYAVPLERCFSFVIDALPLPSIYLEVFPRFIHSAYIFGMISPLLLLLLLLISKMEAFALQFTVH